MKRMVAGIIVLAFFFVPYCVPYKESLAETWEEKTLLDNPRFSKQYSSDSCRVFVMKEGLGVAVVVLNGSLYAPDILIQTIEISKPNRRKSPLVEKDWVVATVEDNKIVEETHLIETVHHPPDIFKEFCAEKAKKLPSAVLSLFFGLYALGHSSDKAS